jgi:GT2 family glycosyltransferase
MAQHPSVHVVILNWNGLQDSLECLGSLTAQNYPCLVIHVIDNGSKENESEIIRQHYPDVNVITLPQNLGFCGGNNVGIRQALDSGADYVMILNNDTIAPPTLIKDLLETMKSLQDVGAVSPVILHYPDKEKIWFAGSIWEPETAGFRHLLSGHSRNEVKETEPYLTQYACGCCLLSSASVLRAVGLLDEKYFAYYDEADWCSRMSQLGLQCYVIPKATLYHKVSRSTPGIIATYLMSRNRLIWMRDYLTRKERWKSYPYLLRESVWNVVNTLRKNSPKGALSKAHSKAMLRGILDYSRRKLGIWPKDIEKLANSGR